MPKAIKVGTVVRLGQSSYRVTGNERQGADIIARGVRVGGRGRLGAKIYFNVNEVKA